MSIVRAIHRAYKTAVDRNWDTIYWAIDLHGVCFGSTYERGHYRFLNDDVKKGLQSITSRKENKIILWSSCHPEEQTAIVQFFKDNGIDVAYFNKNPEVPNTETGCFDSKFYFSILLDDKAGFDPDKDWGEINWFFRCDISRYDHYQGFPK